MFVCLLFVAPLLSLVLYRNAYSYFYPYITPTLAVVAAIGAYKAMQVKWLMVSVVIVMFSSSISQILYYSTLKQDAQIQLISAVKYLFPKRVSYIDRNGIIPSYSKKGFFMSSWGVENYRKSEKAVFESILKENSPPLLIANAPALVAALYNYDDYTECCGLLQEDVNALKQNYIPYWGHIWVAGKRLELKNESMELEFLIAGMYRLEGDGPVMVNNSVLSPGGTMEISSGTQTIYSETLQTVQLVLALPARPNVAPSNQPVFSGFRSL